MSKELYLVEYIDAHGDVSTNLFSDLKETGLFLVALNDRPHVDFLGVKFCFLRTAKEATQHWSTTPETGAETGAE